MVKVKMNLVYEESMPSQYTYLSDILRPKDNTSVQN